jgi:hypothetical protein
MKLGGVIPCCLLSAELVGRALLCFVSPADMRTVKKVVEVLETSFKLKITHRSAEKNVRRAEAEVSKMNAITLMFVFAATHLIP